MQRSGVALLVLLPGLLFAAAAGVRRADAEPPEKPETDALPAEGLVIDLDADEGVEATEDGRVGSWRNQAAGAKTREFKATREDGRPTLRKSVEAIRGHNSLVFDRQELINGDEDAFDGLVTGGGYTWAVVLAVHKQAGLEKDVNAVFGNLRNGPMYEGLWAGLDDDNTLWAGSRNGRSFGRWDKNNPKVAGPKLEEGRFYVAAGRMGAGQGEVKVELFVDDPSKPAASEPFPVNPDANPSKLAVGQERDAVEHPGRESFRGEIARLLVWDRPLTDEELADTVAALKTKYGVN